MIKTKRNFIFSIVVLCCISLLSTGLMQPIQTINATDTSDNDHVGCSPKDDIFVCKFPAVDVSNLTPEEIAVLSCDPDYVTPDQLLIQNTTLIDDDGEHGYRGTVPAPVKALILIDEEAEAYFNKPNWNATCSQAANIIECGKGYLKAVYEIDFIPYDYDRFISPPGIRYDYFSNDYADGVLAANHGCDIVVLMFGQACSDGATGVTNGLSSSMYVNASDHGYDNGNLFMHEATHLFGCNDYHYYNGHSTEVYDCIMSDLWDPYHCDICHYVVLTNRFRFGVIITPPSYAASATPFTSGGGAYVNNKNNVLGARDYYYAELYSGSFGNKAVITMGLSTAPVSGYLTVYVYTPTGTGANTIVSVGNENNHWEKVRQTNLQPANQWVALDCGFVTSITQVAVTAYNEFQIDGVSYPSLVRVDAVVVD